MLFTKRCGSPFSHSRVWIKSNILNYQLYNINNYLLIGKSIPTITSNRTGHCLLLLKRKPSKSLLPFAASYFLQVFGPSYMQHCRSYKHFIRSGNRIRDLEYNSRIRHRGSYFILQLHNVRSDILKKMYSL